MRKIICFLFTIIVVAIYSACTIDKHYDLRSKNIDYQINAGQQIVVPIGNFSTIKIGSLLSNHTKALFSKDEEGNYIYDPAGTVLYDLELGNYNLLGLSFIDLKNTHVPHLKFFMTLKNTMPFDMNISCKFVDTLGAPIEGITGILDADIPAGTEEYPGLVETTLNISSKENLLGGGFNGLVLVMTVGEMPTSKTMVAKGCGLAVKNVKIQLPDGINFRIKKNKVQDSE